MGKWVKRIIGILVVAFLLFWLFTRPESFADALKGIGSGIAAVGRFFTQLLS